MMSAQQQERALSTADLAAASQAPERQPETPVADDARDTQALAALFAADAADGFRSRWNEVQIAFVDDPRKAVRDADELVAQVMKSLAETFSNERSRLEQELGQTDKGSTENLRLALQRYRSFFQRLLSL
ncbi:hypothetical protein [Piscinibacter sp. XHJ-5]|uniref:hypothetical protein n=1 Tax=Piscinibacter sp. XHJ-5 TaxID=3037797 RepID=UPI002452E1D8|nr:hypothetical protein [Piscinibacter sp. XHJ-5]